MSKEQQTKLTTISFEISENPLKFSHGGRKRKDGEAFAKIERELDLTKLPQESIVHALTYGLRQFINDNAAGVKSNDEFVEAIDSAYEALINGDFSSERGERVLTVDGLAMQLLRQFVTEQIKARNLTVTKEQKAGLISAKKAKDYQTFVDKAKAILATQAPESSEDDDLFAGL